VAGRPSETSGAIVEREIRVEADPETVFPFFTDPEKLVRWMGVGATLDPRPGGLFSFHTLPQSWIEGRYVAVEPNTRVVFTWGYGDFPEESNPLPPGSSTVEVELVPDGAATIVRLTHRIPTELADFHALGWEHYLDRLAIAATRGDPGPDLLAEFLESMADRGRA
jgi:uncharacterized protein YndB with AHSA1/START domain